MEVPQKPKSPSFPETKPINEKKKKKKQKEKKFKFTSKKMKKK